MIKLKSLTPRKFTVRIACYFQQNTFSIGCYHYSANALHVYSYIRVILQIWGTQQDKAHSRREEVQIVAELHGCEILGSCATYIRFRLSS